MQDPTDMTQSAYRQSVRALLGLHTLHASGVEEGDEIEALLNVLERHWDALTDAERARTGELSGDLNSLDEARPDPGPLDARSRAGLEAELSSAGGQPDETLDVIRRWTPRLSGADSSRRRGLAWQSAGDREVAAIFFEHAARVGPAGVDRTTGPDRGLDPDRMHPTELAARD